MRDIKFRAWDKLNKKFIFSDWKYGIVSFWEEISQDYISGYEPIQQFTGLLDKNKTPIYEGDVLELKGGGDRNLIGEVIFEYGCFCFKADWIKEGASYPELKYYTIFKELPDDAAFKDVMLIEVIGNIYEHPNLLK